MKTFINTSLLVAVLIFILSGCTKDFEEINTNPNAPLATEANPALILPKILYETGNHMTSSIAWGLGNEVSQMVSPNNFTGTSIYSWGTYSGTWDLMYRNIRDAQNLYAIGEIRENDNMKGAALVLKSWMFSIVTDMWGDVPYTEAIKGKTDAILTPAYDEQKTIYAGILADLEEAANLFNAQNSLDGDIMYGGDYVLWTKLANSLRLRVLMRLENKWSEMGIDGASELQKIVTDGVIFETNADNAKIDYLSSGANRWPKNTSRVGSFDEKRMSTKIEGVLKSINDPRLEILFRPVDNPDSTGIYRGIPNGLSEDNASNYNGGAKNQSRLGTMFRESPDAVDMIIIHYPEVAFLLAEAAEKGYISGTAEDYYMAGTQATLDYYGATVSGDYFTQDGVAYNMNDNESKLELIAKQKWLSLFMVGTEAWFDWRRTGLPELIPGPDALFNEVPVRIQYPDDEQVLNGANLDAAISRQGANEIHTKMWLLK